LRLAVWTWFQGEPLYVCDERDYDVLARNLLTHGEFAFSPGQPTSLRPPLFPTVIAGVYGLCGLENYQAVRLLQQGFALLTMLVLYRLGSEVHSRKLGLWLAGLCGFYPSLLLQANLLLTETLFTLLLASACYALVLFYKRDALAWLAATGVLLGLAALTRSVVWLSPPLLALFVLLTWRAPWRRRLRAPLLLVAAFALTVAPWAARNSRLQGTFVAIDTMGGRNFMMGNYHHTPLYRSWDAISNEGELAWNHEVFATYAPEMRTSQGAIDKLALRQGLKFVAEHPWLTLQRDLIKFFDFWGLERELVAGAARGYWGDLSRPFILLLAALIFASYAAVMALGIFGAILTPLPDRRLHWFFLLVIAYVCGIHTLVFAHSRYHLPVMPLVLVFAASALVKRHTLWQRRHSWSFRCACGCCAVLVGGWTWGLLEGDFNKFLEILRPAL
jgi:4-amino-4-deoxy-L-arabinose transferase-like glycosyltransferase